MERGDLALSYRLLGPAVFCFKCCLCDASNHYAVPSSSSAQGLQHRWTFSRGCRALEDEIYAEGSQVYAYHGAYMLASTAATTNRDVVCIGEALFGAMPVRFKLRPACWLHVAVLLNLKVVASTEVALCFFGLTRSLELTVSNIRSSIMDPLLMADINFTTYLHTYSTETLSNARTRESLTPLNWKAYKLLKPDRFQVDSTEAVDSKLIGDDLGAWMKHGDAWQEAGEHVSLRNYLKLLYSLKEVTKLWLEDNKIYDVVFYLRSDIWFFNKLQIHEIEQAVRSPSTLYTPCFHKWGGLNDRLAFGSPSIMELYGNRLDHAQTYSSSAPLHAEKFLLHIAKFERLNYSGTTELLFERVRATGELWGIPTQFPVPCSDAILRPGIKIEDGPLGKIEFVPLST